MKPLWHQLLDVYSLTKTSPPNQLSGNNFSLSFLLDCFAIFKYMVTVDYECLSTLCMVVYLLDLVTSLSFNSPFSNPISHFRNSYQNLWGPHVNDIAVLSPRISLSRWRACCKWWCRQRQAQRVQLGRSSTRTWFRTSSTAMNRSSSTS
jgi:hypothetical protein